VSGSNILVERDNKIFLLQQLDCHVVQVTGLIPFYNHSLLLILNLMQCILNPSTVDLQPDIHADRYKVDIIS